MNRLLWLFLIVTRLRDRLRCPSCSAVGTYKLHAPVWNTGNWLCVVFGHKPCNISWEGGSYGQEEWKCEREGCGYSYIRGSLVKETVKQIRPWRWLCKWCGYYDGPEGKGLLCCPSPTFGCWIFRAQTDAWKGHTPEEAVRTQSALDIKAATVTGMRPRDENMMYRPWPWRG